MEQGLVVGPINWSMACLGGSGARLLAKSHGRLDDLTGEHMLKDGQNQVFFYINAPFDCEVEELS